MKKILFRRIAVLIAVMLLAVLFLQGHAGVVYAEEEDSRSFQFTYLHDPMLNPKAYQDIIPDPTAVYGYRPNPESVRLGIYAEEDWTNEAFVNEMKAQREAYHESLHELYDLLAALQAEGKTTEEIARAVSTRRNEIRIEAYKDDPEGLEKMKQSNLKTYGNENGPTPDQLFEKYGSWETVIEKAFSANVGADACLGLYDKYYQTYLYYNVNFDEKGILLSETEFTFNGKVQKPALYTSDGMELRVGIDCRAVWSAPASKNAGTYTVTVIGKGDFYSGTASASYTINRADNPLKLKPESKSIKRSSLSKAKNIQIHVTDHKGRVTYSPDHKAKAAKIKVNTKGKVLVPKNCRRGTYIIRVKAAGTHNYKAGSRKFTIRIQ